MINFDEKQLIIKNKLDELAINIKNYHFNENKFNLLSFFKPKTTPANLGFYIYGDVGRGKTVLMKYFYENVKNIEKEYYHFHQFMHLIHQNLHKIRKQSKKYNDELIMAVKMIISHQKLICFDEFQVQDVADAMLLSRIFQFFFKEKIFVVITSNLHPLKLYVNGLQREFFLQFVKNDLITNLEILSLNHDTDYRKKFSIKEKRFLVKNTKNREIFNKKISDLIENKVKKTKIIQAWGREFEIKNTFGEVVIIDFKNFFAKNLSYDDYREFFKNFEIIFVKNIPKLDKSMLNEIRRFTLFIDEGYEANKQFYFLSKCSLKDLELHTAEIPYFMRTLSRIHELSKNIQKKIT